MENPPPNSVVGFGRTRIADGMAGGSPPAASSLWRSAGALVRWLVVVTLTTMRRPGHAARRRAGAAGVA